jgi:hypothetical protein
MALSLLTGCDLCDFGLEVSVQQTTHMKKTGLWDAAPCSVAEFYRRFKYASIIRAIALYQTTRRTFPEYSHLYTCHRENLKFQQSKYMFVGQKLQYNERISWSKGSEKLINT